MPGWPVEDAGGVGEGHERRRRQRGVVEGVVAAWPGVEAVAAARDDGRLRADVDPAVAVAALQGVLLLELHADRLAPHHEAAIDLLTEALAQRLAAA